MLLLERNVKSQALWEKWGSWFASERRARKFTQIQVAKGVKIERTHLSDLENGKSGSKRDTVIALAEFIGADVSEALARAGMTRPAETSDFIIRDKVTGDIQAVVEAKGPVSRYAKEQIQVMENGESYAALFEMMNANILETKNMMKSNLQETQAIRLELADIKKRLPFVEKEEK